MNLSQIEHRLIELEARFNEWRYPISKEEWDKQRRRDELTTEWEDYERDRDKLRQQMDYDPHPAFVPIFDELCDYYLTAPESEREAIREMVLRRDDYFISIETNYYVEVCAEQLRLTGDRAFLVKGLVAVSIENVGSDYRDSTIWLDDLRHSAQQAGIDPYPYLEHIATISSDQVARGGFEPLQLMIRKFSINRQERDAQN